MITKTALHAIRALACLAELPAGEYAGAAAVADRIGAPSNYLGKLLQQLARVGVVRSRKGAGGGFALARPPGTITLYEVVEPIDHVSRWSGCFLGRSACDADAPCAVHDQWATLREQYLRLLAETSIAEVLGSGELTVLRVA